MSKQINQRDAEHYIETRQEFTASAMSGTRDIMSEGRLSGADCERYYQDRQIIDFVVYSYHTPIAWHREGLGWYIVGQKFSQTTSKHQNAVKRAVSSELVGAN
jgi:hypothetical protein